MLNKKQHANHPVPHCDGNFQRANRNNPAECPNLIDSLSKNPPSQPTLMSRIEICRAEIAAPQTFPHETHWDNGQVGR